MSLKWVLPDEEFSLQASALRDLVTATRGALFAPSLWLDEVASGIVVAVRRRRLTDTEGLEALADVLDADVRFVDLNATGVSAAALRSGIGAHDAAYVTVARDLDLPLRTGDRRFYETARRSIPLVHWIGDFAS